MSHSELGALGSVGELRHENEETMRHSNNCGMLACPTWTPVMIRHGAKNGEHNTNKM